MSNKNEGIIYLRRITDITSPFETSFTEEMDVQDIFTLQTLEAVVYNFC